MYICICGSHTHILFFISNLMSNVGHCCVCETILFYASKTELKEKETETGTQEGGTVTEREKKRGIRRRGRTGYLSKADWQGDAWDSSRVNK